MFKFKDGFFTDVRTEDTYETRITYTNGKLESMKEKKKAEHL